MIQVHYQARRISKAEHDLLKKTRTGNKRIMLDSLNGFLVVEPAEAARVEGEILPPEVADYELSNAWCLDSPAKLAEARALLQLKIPDRMGRRQAELTTSDLE